MIVTTPALPPTPPTLPPKKKEKKEKEKKKKKRNKLIRRTFVYICLHSIKWRSKTFELNGIDAFSIFIIVEQHQLADQKM